MAEEFRHIIKPFLIKCLEDLKEYPVVRHESGEGLSNFAYDDDTLLPLFEKYSFSDVKEVSGTCQIAVEKVKTYKELKEKYALKYSNTREPAAPFIESDLDRILNLKSEEEKLSFTLNEKIESIVFSSTTSLFTKYRALYLLRDRADELSIHLLAKFLER